MMNTHDPKSVGRRDFLRTAAVTVAGTGVLTGAAAHGASNGTLKLGLVGCGNRGIWIGNLFQEHSDTKVVAVHDYFEDRVDQACKRLDVDSSKAYTGLDGFKKILDSDVDAVAIESPPYFHPEQAVAALDAGKHVYLAKPIAVDVAGCMAIVEAAKKAHGKLSVLVDFQTRKDPFYQEAAKRIHAGEIGKPVCGQSFYYCGRLGTKSKPGTEAARLRNWVFDIALSGDIIVEQNIHVLDVANWFLQGHPLEATGSGGRKARTDVGDCWDHFNVNYTYPDDVRISFSSGQFCYGFGDLCTRIFCDLGTLESHYGGEVNMKGKSMRWDGGVTSKIYMEGAVRNIQDFHKSIVDGEFVDNAKESANSTLTSILGRMAAYTGRTVTWDEMIASNEKLDANLNLPADGPSIGPVRG